MISNRILALVVVAVGLSVFFELAPAAQTPAAQAPVAADPPGKLIEFSNEARFQLDLQVPDAAVRAFLPAGWNLNVAAQGNAKDCNLRVIFIDRLTINGPDGRPVGKGSNRLVYLAVPVREPGGANVQLIVGGLTEDAADVPGPFGNYLLATAHAMQRSSTSPASGNGPIMDSQDWTFGAATGEHLELHIKYERGVANKGALNDTRFYSAKTPGFFQISRQEQVLEVLRNVTTNPRDRVLAYSFKASGGSFAKLFDGSEKTLSWDNILWINRSVFLPGA